MCASVCAIVCAPCASEYGRCEGSTTLATPLCLYNLPCLPVQRTPLLQHEHAVLSLSLLFPYVHLHEERHELVKAVDDGSPRRGGEKRGEQEAEKGVQERRAPHDMQERGATPQRSPAVTL